MTNITPNPPPEPSESNHLLTRLTNFIKKPSTLIVGGMLLTVGVTTYAGLNYFVHQKLSPLLSRELSKLLQREVKIGEVESFYFNQVRLGFSTIPATKTDTDYLEIKAIAIGFNPFPILIGKPLAVNITLNHPTFYIEQDQKGEWLQLPTIKEEGELNLPIGIKTKVRLDNTNIQFRPHGLKKSLNLDLEGEAGYVYQSNDNQWINYDVAANIFQSNINIKGETHLKSWKTQADLTVNQLDLPQLVSFVPNLPLTLKSGQVNGNFNLLFNALDNLEENQSLGQVNISSIEADIKPLQVPLKANLNLEFEGKNILFKNTEISLGKLVTEITGSINWQKGYNLNFNINPISLSNLVKIIPSKLPLSLQGELAGKIKLNGELTNPILTGSINNTKSLLIDQIAIKNLKANFTANLDQVQLQQLQILPTAGGRMTAKGKLETGILKSIQKQEAINWQKMPLLFGFEAQLPTQKLLTPYLQTSQKFSLGNITAKGSLSRTLGNPLGKIEWQTANLIRVSGEQISGQGNLLLSGTNILLKDTVLRSTGGNITVNGLGNFKANQWQTNLTANSFVLNPLLTVACSFISCSDKILSQAIALNKANLNLSGKLNSFEPRTFNGKGNFLINLDGGVVAINSNLSQGNLNATASLSEINLDPFLTTVTVPIKLAQTNVNFSGSIEEIFRDSTFNINSLSANGNLQLVVAGSPINSNFNLGNGIVGLETQISQLALNQVIPNLPIESRLISSNFTLTGNLNSLIKSLGKSPDFTSFQANGTARLAVNNGQVNVTGRLNNGQISAMVNLGELSLDKMIPELPIAAQLIGGKINLSSPLTPLLSTTPNLDNLNATINLQLATAQGRINSNTQLHGNQWNTNITGSNLNSALILSQIAPQLSSLEISDLNSKINLSGSLKGIFQGQTTIPIQVNTIAFQTNGQMLKGQGSILLSNLLTNPDITKIDLSVNASSNFEQLPLIQLMSLIPLDKKLLPEELSLKGKGQFTGQFIAKNLLTSPNIPGNIQLLGNLKLTNFAINNRIFEPSLSGKLNVIPGKTIALNLKGKQDTILAKLTACNQNNCPIPYLPVSFELRQTFGEQIPIIATGKLQNNRLITQIQAFPLDLFNITPGQQYGILGVINGSLDTQIEIDPFTLQGWGKITIQQPRLGFIKAEKFTAEVSYNNNIAALSNARLILGQSNYNLNGSINLKSGALQGNLNIEQGYIEDLLTALRISNVERFLHLIQLQPIDYATSEKIGIQSAGNANRTIAEQVNLLAIIDQKIRQLANEREAGSIPTELDLRGRFNTNISLTGTLFNPTINVAFSGKKWEWHPQKAFPDIVEPLGLVIRDQKFIPINQVQLQANLSNGVIAIETAKIQIKETLLSLDGKFSLEQIAANWNIQRLSLDTTRNFVPIPVDISGDINLAGKLEGTLFNPQIKGQFSLVDASFQGRFLNQIIAGQFNYQDQQLKLLTTDPSFVYSAISVPFPIYPDNNTFDIDIRLDNNALQLIGILTQEQIVLSGGEGEIIAKATGRIDLNQGLRLYDLNAQGNVNLNQIILRSPTLPEPLTITGQIIIDDQTIQVPQLQGTFAKSTLAMTGILPLFESNSQIETPLTVAIQQGKIDLQGLYNGQIEGNIIVTGNAIKPIVGGQIILANGEVFIPQTPDTNQAEPIAAFNQWSKIRRQAIQSEKSLAFIPELQDFRVSLQGLSIESLPIYQFQFGGDLLINGHLNNFATLQPEGSIIINRGLINFLETRFFMERRHLNQVVFQPEQGLLNPELDMQLRTIVSEVPNTTKQLRTGETSEIPDDSLNKVQRIDINLALKGSLNQLIPNLNQDQTEVCQIRNPLQPIRTETTFSEAELEQLETCLTLLANQRQGTPDEQLLSNPVISLTSNPPRSQGEIVRLLGEQLFVLADALQGQNTEQLIQFGIVQLALPMVFQTIIYDIETAVSDTIGSTDFRVVPFLETIYEVENKGFVRLSYDYGFNEFRVRYEKRF